MTSHFAPCFRLRRALLWLAAWLAFWPAAAWCADGSYEPKPISDAERAAVEAVLAFLETGPNAVLTRLASDSPLRAFNSNQALDEIAVRMGPGEGSHWQLRTPGRTFEKRHDVAIFTVEFPSGIDDIILFHMAEEGGAWTIHQIRCGVDPRVAQKSAEEELQELFSQSGGPELPGPGSRWPGDPPMLLLAATLLALGALALAALAGRRHTAIFVLGAAILASGCHLLPSDDEAEVEEVVELDALSLAPLLPLRRALTGGRSSGTGEQAALQSQIGDMVLDLVGQLDSSDLNSLAARAWQAQLLVLDGNIGAATKILDAAPKPDALPLMALLRARVSTAVGDDDVVKNYERARRLGPDHDGLAEEAALGVASVGEDGKMEDHVRSQVWMDSRTADAFYHAAEFEAYLDQMEKAEKLFRAGWEREPLSRFELLREPVLAHIAIRPGLFPLLEFVEAQEPRVGPKRSATRPLVLPERASSRVLGEHLVVEIGDRTLTVYGAGDVLPEATAVESAAERIEREADAAVARFDELATSLATGALRPSHRRAVEALANTLVYRENWQELIRLTEPLAVDPAAAPPSLIQARALALMRAEKTADATNLIVELARSDQVNRRRDPATFYFLGEMLVELRQYDLAMRAMEKASSLRAFDFTAQRRKQIELMKDLEESKSVYESRHYRLIYPTATGERYPRQLSWVLEAEWDRIKKWIPVPARSPKVEIHLYPWRKFMTAYARSGGLVGGLYDGVVRAPLADFDSFHPELLRIYSHEIAHAMIDIATKDRAPSWFHEGLAGHIEMHQRQLNPMPDMHAAGRDLTFTLLEPVLSGWSEPQLVELAYTNAAWTLHFIETKKGVQGIHRMLDAFRRGHDTEGSIRKVFGKSIGEFDRSFRDWAINEAPQIWQTEVVAYHEQFDSLVNRDSMDPLNNPKDDEKVLRSASGRPAPAGVLERDMKRWHTGYTASVRPVKVALAKAMPLLQGQKEGDIQGACRELRSQLDLLLGTRSHLEAPDANVALNLRRAYGSFRDMAQNCRAKKWNSMRADMEQAVNYLGQAKDGMHPYGVAP